MKAVLLLGGSGSRLQPLTKVCNKHMIPVGGKPMAQWNVEKLVKNGIKDILVISGTHHIGSIIEYFGSGEEFGCNFTYKVQEKAGGIAEALKLVEGFVSLGDVFITILGDNIFEDDLVDFTTRVKMMITPCLLTSTTVEDPERFGVFQDGVIVEKPEVAKTNKIVAGVYGYRYDEFFKKTLEGLKYSSRGELEITDLNNRLMCQRGFRSTPPYELQGYWTDAGTHESLKKANELVSQ